MELLADESVDCGIVNQLRQKGIAVHSVSEDFPGLNDFEVIEVAYQLNFILIKEDKDFGELVFWMKYKHHDILLIRLADIPSEDRINLAADFINTFLSKFENNFCVLMKKGLRVRSVVFQAQR